jgi:hypothetical protein
MRREPGTGEPFGATGGAASRGNSRVHRLVLGSPDGIAGTAYGTIVVMGTIVAGSRSGGDPWQLGVVVATTVVVLWLAHVYANGLAESLSASRRLDVAAVSSIARHEASMPLAAVAPVVVLFAGATDVVGDATAVWVSLAVGVATLGAQGFRYAHLERMSRAATVATVAFNLGLGLLIVALKAGVDH